MKPFGVLLADPCHGTLMVLDQQGVLTIRFLALFFVYPFVLQNTDRLSSTNRELSLESRKDAPLFRSRRELRADLSNVMTQICDLIVKCLVLMLVQCFPCSSLQKVFYSVNCRATMNTQQQPRLLVLNKLWYARDERAKETGIK
jgi:hypothetical protein